MNIQQFPVAHGPATRRHVLRKVRNDVQELPEQLFRAAKIRPHGLALWKDAFGCDQIGKALDWCASAQVGKTKSASFPSPPKFGTKQRKQRQGFDLTGTICPSHAAKCSGTKS